MRNKSENKLVQNAILIGIGILGIRYIIPMIKLPNIDLPDYPDINSSNHIHNDLYASNYMQIENAAGNENNDEGKSYPEDDHIIDYSPPIDDNPNPGDDGKTNPVDHIIDYSPPIDDISPPDPGDDGKSYPEDPDPEIIIDYAAPIDDLPNPDSGSTYSSKGSPELDPEPYKPPSGSTYPIIEKTEPIASKTTLISSMRGMLTNLINDLMLGDKTWYYSQQDVIDMERIKTQNRTANSHCCEFVEENNSSSQQTYKDIFY